MIDEGMLSTFIVERFDIMYITNAFHQKIITKAYEAIDDLENSHSSNMKTKTKKAPGYEAIGEI